MAERRTPAHVRAEIGAERARLEAAFGAFTADVRRACKVLSAGAGSLAGLAAFALALALRRRRRGR